MSKLFSQPVSVNDVAGVVVWFNPERSVIDNISSYINEVSHLFIVDNSESVNSEWLSILKKKFSNITYLPNQENAGIAKALNTGAQAALLKECKWLLTMDQDSRAHRLMVKQMIEVINKTVDTRVGIIAPSYIDKNTVNWGMLPGIREVSTVITSGNLLNLSAFKEVGEFDERLFIDYVDHEYCLRLRRKHYKILQVNSAILYHNLGHISSFSIANKKMFYSNHSAMRRYYITRNRFYVMNQYKKDFPSFFREELLNIWKEFFKILFFEKSKFDKITSMAKGFVHFTRGRYGKL